MGYPRLLSSQRAAGALFNTYTAAKSVINPQAITPIPPKLLNLGDILRVRVRGGLSNIVTAQPTFTFQHMIGPVQPAAIIAATTQAILTNTAAHVLIPFFYEMELRVDSDGNGTNAKFLPMGSIEGIQFVISGAVGDPTAGVAKILCPATAPAVGTGFDLTVLNYLDFFCGISVSQATNGIQIYHYTVELLSEEN